jgi:hypothetical protein
MPMTFLSGVFYSIHSCRRFGKSQPCQSVLLHDDGFSWLLASNVSPWLRPGHRGQCTGGGQYHRGEHAAWVRSPLDLLTPQLKSIAALWLTLY